MKTSRVILLFWLPLTLAFLSAGCATQRPLVNTWRDPQFSPTPADKIALTDRPNPSAQDAAMDRLLVTELQREGFTLTSSDQADYLITYVLDEANEERKVVNGSYSDPMSDGPPTPQTDAQGFAMSYQPIPPPERVTTYSFTSKSILLHLYTNPKTQAGKFQMVWQGDISVNQSVPAGHEQVLFRTLLGYFGKNQNGPVNLAP
jgi:hypothetical protein